MRSIDLLNISKSSGGFLGFKKDAYCWKYCGLKAIVHPEM